MKSIEFDAVLGNSGQIALPQHLVPAVPAGEKVHVVLQWTTPIDEDASLQPIGVARFEAAYAPEDEVYEALLPR